MLIYESKPEETFKIAKSLILSFEEKSYYSKNPETPKQEWTIFYVDEDFMKDTDSLIKISNLKKKGHLFIYGKTRFGINWDAVIERVYSRPAEICFFCDEKLTKHNKTKDHLIPTVILTAYGLVVLEDNTVPSCRTCNSEKASLHPYIYRSKLQYLLKHDNRDRPRRSIALGILNQILIKKEDIFQ